MARVVTDIGTVDMRPVRVTLDSVLGCLETMPDEPVYMDREIETSGEVGVIQKTLRLEGR